MEHLVILFTGMKAEDRSHSPRTDASQHQTSPKPGNFVKPATFDGSGMWNDYLSHFEFVCLLNEWTEIEAISCVVSKRVSSRCAG